MKKFALLFAFLLSLTAGGVAEANQTPTASYCTPQATIVNGQSVDANPVMTDFEQADTCGGQMGDLWSDGPIYPSWTFSYTDSSFSFTIPANVWVIQGVRVYGPLINETVGAGAITYFWLNVNGIWEYTTTSSPPSGAASDLEYTVSSNSTGITGVTVAASAIASPTFFGIVGMPGFFVPTNTVATIQLGANSGTTYPLEITSSNESPLDYFFPNGAWSTSNGYVTGDASGNINANAITLVAGASLGSTLTVEGGTFNGYTLMAESGDNLQLASNKTAGAVLINYGASSQSGGLQVYDDGTTNYAKLGYNALTFSGGTTSSYTSTAETIYGITTLESAGIFNSTLTSPASNTATSSVNYGSIGSLQFQSSIWGGSLASTETWALSSVSNGAYQLAYNSAQVEQWLSEGNNQFYELLGTPNTGDSSYGVDLDFIKGGSTSTTILTSSQHTCSATLVGVTPSAFCIKTGSTELWALDTSGDAGLAGAYSTAGAISSSKYILAGSATGPSMTNGDLGASRSTTTGALLLGGSSSSCLEDYGITNPTSINIACNLYASEFFGSGAGLFNGTVPIVALAADTISGIALGNNLPTLTFSTHLTASSLSYNGSTSSTIATDATNSNTVSTIVARDSSGNFSAGTVTATLNGSITTADVTTNATYYPVFSLGYGGAYALDTAHSALSFNPSTGVIQATQFSGSGAGLTSGSVPITALASDTISGITLGGTLPTLTIGTYLTGTSYNGSTGITIATDATNANTASTLVARDSSGNFSAGTVTATLNGSVTTADVTTNATYYPLFGTGYGGAYAVDTTHGALSFNPSTGVLSATTFSGSGANFTTASITNSELANSTISGVALGGTLYSLTPGTHLSGGAYNGSGAITIATDATNSNTASTIVSRDSSGNFSAGTITATLSGNVTTSDITTNETVYPAFVTGYGGADALDTTHLALNFNPSTGVLTATEFNGSGGDLSSGSVPISALASDTISGIPLGSSLDTLTFGTHLVAGGSSYNGGSAVTISTDATNADTVSTIVARDSSGNIIVSGITASTSGLTSGSSTYGPTSTTINGNIILNSTSVIEFGTSSNNLYLEVPGSGTTVSGVGCSLLGIAKATAPTYEACFDTGGDFGVGNIYDAGLTSGDLAGVTTNGELTSVTVGNGLTNSSGNLSVSGCANTTCQKSVNSPLCFISGTVTTGTAGQQCPGWVPKNLSNASINTLTAYCQTADNGTTVFTIYQNGSSFSTITLGTSNVTTKSVSLTLTNGDVYTAAITTAGTGEYCSLLMSGLENVQ